MAQDEEGRSFAERYAAKRSKSDEEVSDWINGRGQLVIVGVFALIALWFIVSLVIG